MKKQTKLITLLSFLILETSCVSYFKPKECESLNWFELGQKIAMTGERVDSSSLVRDCRKVEAEFSETQLDFGFKSEMQKYCDADNLFRLGKEGSLFQKNFARGLVYAI